MNKICKLFGFGLLFIGLAFTLTGCDDSQIPDEFDRYELMIELGGMGVGEITPQQETYAPDSVVDFDIKTGKDSTFYGWAGPDADDIIEENGQYKIRMDSDKQLKAIFIKKTQMLNTFTGHSENERVLTVDFSSDDSMVVSGSADNTVKVWVPLTGEVLYEYGDHGSSINTAIFSSDNHLVVFGGGLAGRPFKLWDLDTDSIIREFHHTGGDISGLDFSADDSMIVSGGTYNNKTVEIWETETGDRIRSITEESGIDSVCFSPDDTLVMAGLNEDSVKVWDVETGELLTHLNDLSFQVNVDFSSDGSMAVASDGSDAIVWDPETGAIETIFEKHSGLIQSVAFSSDNRMVVSASRDNTVKVWDVETGEIITDFTHHNDWVFSAVFSSDDSMVVSASDGGVVKVWEWK